MFGYHSGHDGAMDGEGDSLEEADGELFPVYVVAIPKLIALNVATVGIYGTYWSYRHWKQYRDHVDSSIWPIARGLFAIFHVVRLCRWLDALARRAGHHPAWSPSLYAATWIVLVFVERLTDRLNPEGHSIALTIVSVSAALLAVVPLIVAQGVANLAAGDKAGRSNSKLTLANWVVIGLGMCLWGLGAMTYIDPYADEVNLDETVDAP
jgi:hypothetical protein